MSDKEKADGLAVGIKTGEAGKKAVLLCIVTEGNQSGWALSAGIARFYANQLLDAADIVDPPEEKT